MSKGDAFENQLLLMIFNNNNIAAVGDATGLRGSSSAGQLFVSLHTADPGESGNQSTSECNYSGYARQGVARSGAGWTVTGSSASPAANVNFPNPSDSASLPQTATHFAVGTDASGAGKVLYKGPLSPNIVISNTGVQPIFGAGTTVTED